jgi:hexokinase
MALLEKAKRVAAQFDFTPDDVRRAVKEFIREMGE